MDANNAGLKKGLAAVLQASFCVMTASADMLLHCQDFVHTICMKHLIVVFACILLPEPL